MIRKIKQVGFEIVASMCLMFELGYFKTAYAVPTPPIPKPPPVDLVQVLGKFADYFLMAGSLIAVLMIIIGGLRYIVSAGSPTQTEGAKKTIIYALVGLVIMIMALGTVQLIKLIFTPRATPPTPPPATI